MIWGFHASVLLAGAYALLLAALAAALEGLGRGSHQSAERFHVAGFRYDSERDLWQCPEGRQLFRISSDVRARTAVYQAHPHHCNACHAKPACTDAPDGRRIERRLDSWLESELRRFHRGFTLALLALAAAILAWGVEGPGTDRDRLLLGTLFVATVLVEIRLLAGLAGRARSPENPQDSAIPWH